MVAQVREQSKKKITGFTVGSSEFWSYAHDSLGREFYFIFIVPPGSNRMEQIIDLVKKKLPPNTICSRLGIRGGQCKCSPSCRHKRDISRSRLALLYRLLMGKIHELPANKDFSRNGCGYELCDEAPGRSRGGKDWF